MKILLLGANGQLGWQLRRSLGVVGEVTALARADAAWCGDVNDAAGIAATVRGLAPDVIVNATAYTAVDRAESEPGLAHAVNVQACETLAAEAERAGAWLVHYSTDYVFSGEGERPWRETDPTGPLNVYGRSKLAGEQAIARLCPRHLIFRASWLFDTWGDNFLKSILAAARRHATLQVVSDQWGAPTRAALVADATAHALRGLDARLAGTYHLSAQGETSRHGFATHLLACARRHGLTVLAGPDDVSEVPSSHYPSPARRPLNSRLDTTAAKIAFGVAFPPWQAGVDAVVAELAATAYTR